MKYRVSAALAAALLKGWWLGTFHSLAARMLRRHADLVGLTLKFHDFDADDQVRLVKQLMEDQQIDPRNGCRRRFPISLALERSCA